LSNEMGFETIYPDLKFCGDNAAMIAFVGSMMKPGQYDNKISKVRARWPLNELEK